VRCAHPRRRGRGSGRGPRVKQLEWDERRYVEMPSRNFQCSDCGHTWEVPLGEPRPSECPSCESQAIHRANPPGVGGGGRGRSGRWRFWRGQGRQGRRGGGMGGGYPDYCVCPSCGEKIEHRRGTPCSVERCPNCGKRMVRENSYHHELVKKEEKSG